MSSWRSSLLRRLPGRLRIEDEGAGPLAPDWLGPYWLERQLDPNSPAFTAPGQLPFPANVTHRNWTMVGNIGSEYDAVVDRRGLVTPWLAGWSLDWWIGAEDRWHLPSRETAVSQSLLENTPVVETAMRIPGGAAVHRAYAVKAEVELVVIEVENRSPTPVAVAFALRPYNPEGLARVGRLAADGLTVTADGRPALLLPRPPSAVAVSTSERGDSLHDVTAGRSEPWPFAPVEDKAGLAQIALVYPLPHHTSLKVAVPLRHGGRARRLGPIRRRVEAPPAVNAAAVPSAADVTNGWKAQLRRGLQMELPDAKLQAAVDANRAYMLLFHNGDGITTGSFDEQRLSFRDAAFQLGALDRYGFHGEAAEVLRSYPSRQPGDGNGAAVYAIAEHHRLCGDGVAAEVSSAVVHATRWIARQGREGPGREPADDFWRLRGLVDGAWLLRSYGDESVATDADTAAALLRQSITASLELAAARNKMVAMPAGPRRGLDAGMIGSLVACSPLHLLTAADPWVTGTLDVIRERFCIGDAFFQSIARTGLGTYLTLLIAACELEAGDPRAARRLRWMLDAATDTFTWPEAIHPKLGTGCTGDGHHGRAAAEFLNFVRHTLVRELTTGGVALCSLFPPEWAGLPLELHHAPTHHGKVSFAIRWHGERPALLWECEREGVLLTIPGLDPTWSSSDRTGEALLRPFRTRIAIPLADA